MKKALVTGATGFLGKALAVKLHGLGWEVTAFGRNEKIGNQLQAKDIRFFKGDLMDETAVRKACSGQDIVFHAAALSSPWGRYQDFYNSNVRGTQHIIDGCLSHNVSRLVHISTPSIYFHYKDQFDIPENVRLPKKPANHYAATKRIAETLVLEAYQKGLPSMIIRPRAIFGPGDNALFPRLIRANEKGGIPLFRGGQIKMDITYIDNVVDALLLCANAPEAALGYAYNITNQEPVILIEVLKQIFEQINQPLKLRRLPYPFVAMLARWMEMKASLFHPSKEPIMTRYSVAAIGKHQTLDNTLAKEKLGYKPAVSVSEGIRKFTDWWIQHEHSMQ